MSYLLRDLIVMKMSNDKSTYREIEKQSGVNRMTINLLVNHNFRVYYFDSF